MTDLLDWADVAAVGFVARDWFDDFGDSRPVRSLLAHDRGASRGLSVYQSGADRIATALREAYLAGNADPPATLHADLCTLLQLDPERATEDDVLDLVGGLLDEVYLCTAQRDEARGHYRFMVERAADARLDGYRELGARAAAAEEQLDTAIAERSAARREIAALEWLALRGYPVGRCPETGRVMARYDVDTNKPRWFATWADAARDCGWEE